MKTDISYAQTNRPAMRVGRGSEDAASVSDTRPFTDSLLEVIEYISKEAQVTAGTIALIEDRIFGDVGVRDGDAEQKDPYGREALILNRMRELLVLVQSNRYAVERLNARL